MIEELRIPLAAYFYRRKARITQISVRTLFQTMQREAENAARPIFKAVRRSLGDAVFSAISFAYDRPVPFLENAADRVERVYGFLLLVEKDMMVTVFKSGLDISAAFKKTYLESVDRANVERAIARHDAIFEKISLRNMTTSPLALRSKTLESSDLQNSIATTSAGRFVPHGYRVRRPDGSYSATPSTGRIAVRSDRVDHEQAVTWAVEIMGLLSNDVGEASAFIRNFARPVELSRIGAGVMPTYLAVDTMALADAIDDADVPIRLVTQAAGVWHELTRADTDAILLDLEPALAIQPSGTDFGIVDAGAVVIGAIKINKARIALRTLAIPSLTGVFVEDGRLAIGTDPNRRTLSKYIDVEDMFSVLFSDLALAYIDGSLFRDEALIGGGINFLRHLLAEPVLATTTSEKGTFVAGQLEFTPGSVFRAVADGLAGEDVLICDDLGDEWADFIGVTAEANPAMITFYHAKHGVRSLSASAFHDAVGQAIKNLGRLSLVGDVMASKFDGWDVTYNHGHAATAIARLMRGGTRAEIEEQVRLASTAPAVLKRVVLVTSSLSRADVENAFERVAAGLPVRPNFVQLYWILMGFFSACTEIGAVGYVICQP